MLYQQGDVLIRSVGQVPQNAKALSQRPVVLAYGEVTGHKHQILDEVKAFLDGESMYIASDTAFTVTHEEHKPIRVDPGIYEILRVKEYDHFTEEARNVVD